MTTSLTFEHIESTVKVLPIQSRTMIRLLLMQYIDIPQEDIEYMAADQPDSRFLAGGQPKEKIFSREAIRDVSSRVDQYRSFLRQKRERPGLQIECLRQLLVLTELIITVAERLLTSHFNVEPTVVQERKKAASITLLKQERRKLDKALEKEELSDQDYQKERLFIEYQTCLRKREQQRRRLLNAQREFQLSGNSPIQDHEIAHIWGIPLGSLAARKVKALHQYLTSIQEKIQNTQPSPAQKETEQSDSRPDYWKETFTTLTARPIERSIVSYDGFQLERNEETLMEKLGQLASGNMPEETESNFWQAITKIHDSEHAGMWISHSQSIFALQRLSAIQKEVDLSEEAIEEDIMARIKPKEAADKISVQETQEQPTELSEQGIGVLQAFAGELDDKRAR